MSEDPSESRSRRSFLDRFIQVLGGEPKDRGEIIEMLRDAQRRELFGSDALAMIEGVFMVGDMRVRDIMVPRSMMVVVEQDAPLEAILPLVIGSGHSRFPVIGESRDQVLGILLAKDFLRYCAEGEQGEFQINDILRPAVFIPESKRLNRLLKEFRSSQNHMAVVVDEYGGVSGLVTIEDVLEQIVGEIDDEHDLEEDINIRPHSEGRYTVQALTTIDEFNRYFDSDFSDEEFDTIGGLVMNQLGHMPRCGESLQMGRLHFKVLGADSRRVHLLQVVRHDESKSV